MSELVSASVQTHAFTMDDNLLWSIIKSQAGTLSKALTEGVMNSVDAGATAIRISLTTTQFVIEDDGRGFGSEQEIRDWFGRFGTPHKEGDAIYGRFRMGRGQLMAFAVNEWRSGRYTMTVDVEHKGLGYELRQEAEDHRGCRITGTLYQPLAQWQLRGVIEELKKAVAYCPVPVVLNDEQIGRPPKTVEDWTFRDRDAYYQLIPGAKDLRIYNQGIYVTSYDVWRTGMGGVVVSKRALQVNFARNDILQNQCEVWKRIEKTLEQRVLNKLRTTASKKLTESERTYLAQHLTTLREQPRWEETKLLTDPSGRHLPLSDLKNFSTFILLEGSNPLVSMLHGQAKTFVVTRALLARFGSHSLDSWIRNLREAAPELLSGDYQLLTVEDLKERGVTGARILSQAGLPRRQQAACQALSLMNSRIAQRLLDRGLITQERSIGVGRHRDDYQAWTDGCTSITANVRHLRLFEKGRDGVGEWVQILLHEYTHDQDDSESHEHGEVFYRKYHDTSTQVSSLGLTTLAQIGLQEYLRALRELKVARPRWLIAQARGEVVEAPLKRHANRHKKRYSMNGSSAASGMATLG